MLKVEKNKIAEQSSPCNIISWIFSKNFITKICHFLLHGVMYTLRSKTAEGMGGGGEGVCGESADYMAAIGSWFICVLFCLHIKMKIKIFNSIKRPRF